ncbi:hypothetical protein jhhlp_000848 [Lomentospora prolificans]|uniref:FAD/NAD(P)-binding domain-containing protein n=1 Tax=Lomentospora prolificans TaxID=41688 RepID=A0A2N3NJM2_9PEZI|nr:hypothetical protein jhhlp_000848 [Lomentospora prolificans]
MAQSQPQQQRILVIGAGFAGMWSAISARRLLSLESKNEAASSIEVALVSPEDNLVIRPRLYEPDLANTSVPLGELFAATGVRYIQGTVDTIHTAGHEVTVVDAAGNRSTIAYTRLVLAAGSRLVRPNLPGLEEHAFNIDQFKEAVDVEKHLQGLAKLPPSPARNTVVVCGGGFTGIELATELPARLQAALGNDEKVRVVVVERAQDIGPDLGPGPRPVILEAMEKLGVEMKLGTAVVSVDANGVVTADGERIEALTTVWTAGMVANPLTKQIPGEKDRLGRIHVDGNLRVPSAPDVFATGDTAYAMTEGDKHPAMMSCQHAMYLGRFSGHNAAADLLNVPLKQYAQARYATCLDLGSAGSVVCQGWDRQVIMTGEQGKKVKTYINRVLIYPPKADEEDAFVRADPNWQAPALDMSLLAGAC